MRKLLSLIVGALVLATPLAVNAEIVTDGLTNRWKIDEGSGTTTSDSVGGANGTFVNSPAWTTDTPGPNHPPYALDFEWDNYDYVNCGTGTVSTGTAGTVDAWFKLESWPDHSYATVFFKGTSAAWNNMHLALTRNSTHKNMMLALASGSSSITNNLHTDTLSLNTWYHLAGTWYWDGASDYQQYLYLNGEQVDSGTYSITPASTGSDAAYIGRSPYQQRYFDGVIDEVRLYDRALTPEEVLQNYHAIVPEPASLLLLGAALGCLLLRRGRRRR